MSFCKQYAAYLDALFQKCSPETLNYLSVNSLPDGAYSFKVYEEQALDGKVLDACSRAIMDTGLVISTLYVSSSLTDTDRYDFYINNQLNTDERMSNLLEILQNGFDIAPAAMQEIFVLSQMPVLPENSGYRALYCVGVERQGNIPRVCKLHFRTRMSIHYRDCFMDEMYLDYLTRHLPLAYSASCEAARQAVQAGHLLLAGVDCCNGRIVKRKLYIKITNINAVNDAICSIPGLPRAYKDFYNELSDVAVRDNRMFLDGFALCFSDGTLSSINYYLAIRSK